MCALGGRIDLSPGSSREIGASGEGGLRHEDALRDDDDEEQAYLIFVTDARTASV